jgi:hypothetical protein
LQVLEVVHEKGADRVTVEDLVQEIAPRACSMVPDSARKMLAKDVKKFLAEDNAAFD